MVRPIAQDLITHQARAFRRAFKGPRPQNDHGKDVVGADASVLTRLSKLEVDTFFLLNAKELRKGGIETPKALAEWGKAKPAARKKQFNAMGGDQAGFTVDEFDRICKAAAEID